MSQKAANKQEMLSSIENKFLSVFAHDALTSNERPTDPYTSCVVSPYTAKLDSKT